MDRKQATALTSLVVVIVLAALAWYLDRANTDSPTTAPPPSAGDSAAQLAGLAIAPEGKMAGYSRDRFPHWAGQGNSCDTREVVLQKQGANVKNDKDCKAVEGTWVSPYEGLTITNAGEMDIDHTVPLAEAWRSGANSWTTARRQSFANDLTRPQLIAVTDNVNQSKGDQDPSQWQPSIPSYRCTYAKMWITVKSYWALNLQSTEKTALQTMLNTCSS